MVEGVNPGSPTPLYEQIVHDIRQKILRGELRPGDRIETQKELAERYHVSLITIKGAITLLQNEGLVFSRPGKGTFVLENPTTRLNLSQHRAIGLVLRELNHPFFSLIVHSVEERAYELGFHLLLSSSSGKMEKEENQIDNYRKMGVDGLIIASLSMEYRATEHIQRLHAKNVPYVMVSYIHDPEYWFVGSDHELGGFLAAEHLIKIGCRSVGYVHPERKNLLSEVRKNGYARALLEHDLPYDPDVIFSLEKYQSATVTTRYELGHQFGRDFTNIPKRPDALFFYNDMVALGFIQGATEVGIRVPDHVAVVGFDDAPVGRYASVSLTTIHQYADKIGRMAVDIIQKRMDSTEVSKRTIYKPTLVVRDSCGARRKELHAPLDPATPDFSSMR